MPASAWNVISKSLTGDASGVCSAATPRLGLATRVPAAADASATSDHVPVIADASTAYRTISRALTLRDIARVAVLPGQPASLAVIVKFDVPTVTGVPEIAPLAASVRPSGSAP